MSTGRGGRQGRRGWLVPLLALAALLSGCQAGPAAAPPAPGGDQPAPIRLAGRTATRTQPFLLAGGLTVFTAEHHGQGGFKVEILTGAGEPQRVLFLATGRYRGSTGLGLRGGIYRLTVAAGTPWTVEITQPRGRGGASLPQQYEGDGDALVGPFRVDGEVRVDVTNSGEGDITVELLSDQGPSLYFLVEDSGRFTTTRTAAGLEPGNYYLKVEARRAWRLALHPG